MSAEPVARAPERAGSAGERPGPGLAELPGAALAGAWLAIPAVAVALVAAWRAFGRPLARALTAAPTAAQLPLPAAAGGVRPEPREQALYLLALVVPALAAWGLCLGARRVRRLGDAALARAALAVQLAVAAAVGVACVYQARRIHSYFPPARWAIGAAVVVAALAAARAAARWDTLRTWGESAAGRRLRRASAPLALAAAAAYAAARLSSVVFGDASVVAAPVTVSYHLPFTLGEFAAVVNGRTPGADFFPQYAFVLPHLLAPAFRAVGLTVRTFTVAMAALSFVGLVLHYDVLRRATGRPAAALALHVLVVALALHPVEVFPDGLVANAFSYFAVGPLRYLGPWVVGWLVAWHLGRPSASRAAIVFAAAGAAALNNLDFGVPALGAAALALALTGETTLVPRPRALAALALAAAAGVAAAFAGFEVVSFLRAGRLVTLADTTVFQRAFAVLGFGMLPMPRYGLHAVVYGTFMLGLGTALVRLEALRRAPAGAGAGPERTLAGVLVYGSVFGAGALGYYVGRSHQAVLPAVFAAWGSVLALLSWLALRGAARAWGGVRVGAVPALLGLGALALCAGEALPHPFPEATLYEPGSRLGVDKVRYVVGAPAAAARLRALTSPGEKVMVSLPAGHLVAELAGVENVFPFAEWDSCIVVGQVAEVAARIRTDGVTKYFGPASEDLKRRVAAEGLGVTFVGDLLPDER
ncbi:MAG TPA: hypothetical protein VFL83_19135 [Anaeromyxobacter sp.]|nr:hypothetical protein [Anaeromyxobacter sp.]